MRDRLIELLNNYEKEWRVDFPVTTEDLADHLLANGVIVPPCNLGDMVYVTDIFEGKIAECEVIKVECFAGDEVTLIEYKAPKEDVVYSYECSDTELGKTVFLTKKEAEKALAERSENGK